MRGKRIRKGREWKGLEKEERMENGKETRERLSREVEDENGGG